MKFVGLTTFSILSDTIDFVLKFEDPVNSPTSTTLNTSSDCGCSPSETTTTTSETPTSEKNDLSIQNRFIIISIVLVFIVRQRRK